MGILIAGAGHDENGKYRCGKAGDQTGKEVKIHNWYNYPWTHVYRFNDKTLAEKTAFAMERAAANDHIGYDQNERNTLIVLSQSINYDPGLVTQDCECDCSSLVTTALAYAGLPIAELCAGGNCRTTSTLFPVLDKYCTCYTNSQYTQSSTNLQRGDVLIAKGHHVEVVTSTGTNLTTKGKVNINTRKGQQESIKFTNHSIAVDGIKGPNTKKQAVRVLQKALNLDKGINLEIDGILGPKTSDALKNVTIIKGQRNLYMITALEIICLMTGTNPNGVEYPGIYGSGLARGLKLEAVGYKEIIDLLNKIA